MFSDVGNKLKSLAKIVFFVGLAIGLLLMCAVDNFLLSIIIFLSVFMYLPSCWIIYGFGVLIENSESSLSIQQEMNRFLEKTLKNNYVNKNIDTVKNDVNVVSKFSEENICEPKVDRKKYMELRNEKLGIDKKIEANNLSKMDIGKEFIIEGRIISTDNQCIKVEAKDNKEEIYKVINYPTENLVDEYWIVAKIKYLKDEEGLKIVRLVKIIEQF